MDADFLIDLGWNEGEENSTLLEKNDALSKSTIISQDIPSTSKSSVQDDSVMLDPSPSTVDSTHQLKKPAIDDAPDISNAIASTSGLQSVDISSKNKSNSVESSPSEVVKRKRGRPRKSDIVQPPTRESSRLKKCPEVINYDKETVKHCWTNEEKFSLLKGLEDFGPSDVESIKNNYLKKKSEPDIKNQIKMWMQFAQKDLQKKLMTEKKVLNSATVNAIRNLDEWIEYFDELQENHSSKQFALSNFFLLVSEYGRFPSPEECDDIDFRALYRYIHNMLNGQPYYRLNKRSADAINENISHLYSIVRDYNNAKHMQLELFMPRKKERPSLKTYGRSTHRGKSLSKTPEAVLSLSDMNPLNLPPSVLSKPQTIVGDVKANFYEEDDSFEEEEETEW